MIDLRTPEAIEAGARALYESLQYNEPDEFPWLALTGDEQFFYRDGYERIAAILQPALELIEQREQLRPAMQTERNEER